MSFLKQCSESSEANAATSNVLDSLLIFLFALLSSWTLLFTFSCTCLQCTGYGALPCISLISWIEFYRKRFRSAKSVQMLPGLAKLWRKIQLLVTMFNFIHQSIMATCISILVVFVFIISAYSVLAISGKLHVTQVILFSVLVLDTMLLSLDVGET